MKAKPGVAVASQEPVASRINSDARRALASDRLDARWFETHRKRRSSL
jgi:hypothetical protein